MKTVNTSFSVIVTSHVTLKEVFTLFMAGYSYTKRNVHSSWLVTITLKEVFTLFMAGYNYTKRRVPAMKSEHFFQCNCNQP
jgi:general stress protein CsbA